MSRRWNFVAQLIEEWVFEVLYACRRRPVRDITAVALTPHFIYRGGSDYDPNRDQKIGIVELGTQILPE